MAMAADRWTRCGSVHRRTPLCRGPLLSGTLLCRRSFLCRRALPSRELLSRGALCDPLLRPPAVDATFGAVPNGLLTSAQTLTERCTRRARRTGAGHPSERVASTALLQPLASLGREIAKPLAVLKKLTPFGTRHVMPAAVEVCQPLPVLR